MGNVRPARAADVEELLRLRTVMLGSLGGEDRTEPEDDGWRAVSRQVLLARLPGSGTGATGSTTGSRESTGLAGFVVPCPDRPERLVSCALGTLEQRLGAPGNPRGLVGEVFNVATDPAYRRRGFARDCIGALLEWFRDRGAGAVTLNAVPRTESFYEKMGFARLSDVSGTRMYLTPATGSSRRDVLVLPEGNAASGGGDGDPQDPGSMSEPRVGDKVSWNTSQGSTHGRVVERRTADFQLAGQRFTAAEDSPMFIVESDKSGHQAAHRGEALKVRR